MSYTTQTISLVGMDNKVENNGTTTAGRLSALELNDIIDAIIEAQDNITALDTVVSSGRHMTIVEPESNTTAINAEVGKYYLFSDTITNLSIVLPTISSTTEIKSCIFCFTTGSTVSVTIGTQDSSAYVYKFEGFEIKPNTTYEINCIYNNHNWIVAHGIIDMTLEESSD